MGKRRSFCFTAVIVVLMLFLAGCQLRPEGQEVRSPEEEAARALFEHIYRDDTFTNVEFVDDGFIVENGIYYSLFEKEIINGRKFYIFRMTGRGCSIASKSYVAVDTGDVYLRKEDIVHNGD